MKMINASIVVLAEQHNPSILHPSFLKKEKIVDEEWEVKEGGVLCTPPFSTVEFSNRIRFVVENVKLQILDDALANGLKGSLIPTLARKYLETLPHVKYSALGVNFVAVEQMEDASEFLISRYLGQGSWHQISGTELKATGIKLVYGFADCTLTINLDPGTSSQDGGRQVNGVLIRGNFHQPINMDMELSQLFSKYSERCDTFERVAASMIGERE